jgi:nicotinamide-nucleotide amidase
METTLESIVHYLEQHQLKVVTAESCTAGLIASKLAEIPGAGKWLDSAFISYSEDAKIKCLDVAEETIEEFGLTSEEVARAMAEGAIPAANANLAIATTGVAGPSAGDGEEEVGTVCLAWSFVVDGGLKTFSEKKQFPGDRNAVRDAAASYSLERIRHYHRALTAQSGMVGIEV